MALRLSIGFQKKVGLPDYGSAGANCQIEFEIDHSLLKNDLDGFHEKARHAFVACQQAVNDQLSRQTSNGHAANGHAANGNGNGHPPAGNESSGPTNGTYGNGNGNGHSRPANGSSHRQATQSQSRAIRAIASKRRLDLQKLLEARFGVARPESLTLSDASSLIDELKNSADDNGGTR